MPPPTQKHTQEYITLKEYFDIRLELQERALDVAHRAMEKRLDALNEIRGALADQNKMFFTKPEHDVFKQSMEDALKSINSDIRSLRDSRSLLEGKASQTSVIFMGVIAISGLMLSIVGIILTMRGM